MITDPDKFFGRKTELMTIFSRLENFQSCDVYGERKIGKSSLLYYIFKKSQDRLGSDYVIAYNDMQAAENHNVESFLRNSLKELGCKSGGIVSSNSLNQNLIAFLESIKELKKKRKPILLIDEFEVLTKKKEFNDDVFDTLRSLGNNGHIAYVTASLNFLKTLCEKGKFTSRFYNIFSEVKLGKFTHDETMEFLTTRSESFGFNQGEIEFLYEIANNHPLHLQIACNHVFEIGENN
jgi:AAA+ ATPase superfamily predicted ATPase